MLAFISILARSYLHNALKVQHDLYDCLARKCSWQTQGDYYEIRLPDGMTSDMFHEGIQMILGWADSVGDAENLAIASFRLIGRNPNSLCQARPCTLRDIVSPVFVPNGTLNIPFQSLSR
jgi:hypothetical protein